MSHSNSVSSSNKSETEQVIEHAIRSLCAGDFSHAPNGDDPLAQATQELTRRLAKDAIAQLENAVDLSMRVNETGVSCARLTRSTTKAGKDVQEIAAAAEELSASVSSIRESVDRTVSLTSDLKDTADGSLSDAVSVDKEFATIEKCVTSVAERSQALVEATASISKMMRMIQEIAMKTNMLAINASIEAVRAGAAGRGFAVVADEVQALSQQTAQAAEEVTEAIVNLESGVEQLGGAVETSTRSISSGSQVVARMRKNSEGVLHGARSIDEQMQSVATMLKEQKTAAEDVASNAASASEGIDEVAALVSDVNESLDGAVQTISERVAVIEPMELPGKVLRLAKADHVIWKKKLADVFAGKLSISAEELSSHRSCRLGKWYFGAGADEFGDNPVFAALDGPHEAVHENGIAAVEAYNSGDIAAALDYIDLVEAASGEVISALDELIEISRDAEFESVA